LFETLVFAELIRARDHRGLPLSFHFWRTKEGEEVDFLVEAQGARGPRWIAIEAKFSVQSTVPMPVPRSLAAHLPEIHDIWIVTPGGEEVRLSSSSTQVPIRSLADRLAKAVASS
jgi:hypothetical protein